MRGRVFGRAGAGFLIHYGWRGTASRTGRAGITLLFLIHYGWRGTWSITACRLSCKAVSNPLRLEEDRRRHRVALQHRVFLIHYGWRGTC